MQGGLLGGDGISRIQNGTSAFLDMENGIRNKPVRLDVGGTIAARKAGRQAGTEWLWLRAQYCWSRDR